MHKPQVPHTATPAARRAAAKWAAIRRALGLGLRVLYADTDVALLRDPFPLVRGGADVEALGTGTAPTGARSPPLRAVSPVLGGSSWPFARIAGHGAVVSGCCQ